MDVKKKFTNNLCHQLWGEKKQELVNQERFFNQKKKGRFQNSHNPQSSLTN
jgi:hypothetical protein